MSSVPTTRELAAIQALVSAGKVKDPWGPPIHAIDKALQLCSSDSRQLAEDMLRRNLIKLRTRAINRLDPSEQQPNLWWWEESASEAQTFVLKNPKINDLALLDRAGALEVSPTVWRFSDGSCVVLKWSTGVNNSSGYLVSQMDRSEASVDAPNAEDLGLGDQGQSGG